MNTTSEKFSYIHDAIRSYFGKKKSYTTIKKTASMWTTPTIKKHENVKINPEIKKDNRIFSKWKYLFWKCDLTKKSYRAYIL